MSAVRSTILLPALLVAGCASNPSPNTSTAGASPASAVVEVDNQGAYNMDVYVRQREGLVRLGFAPAKQITRLPIPAGFIPGAGIIRFEAHPTPAGERVLSDPFTVHPGDQLSWVIPPQ